MPEVSESPTLIEWEGRSPAGGFSRMIFLRKNTIYAHFRNTGHPEIMEEAFWIPDVTTEDTLSIWQGLQRDGQNTAYCYAGVPSGGYAKSKGIDIVFPANKIFTVFLSSEMEVMKWRVSEVDSVQANWPINHKTRFGRNLWTA